MEIIAVLHSTYPWVKPKISYNCDEKAKNADESCIQIIL